MGRLLTRVGLPTLFLIGLAVLVYVLMAASKVPQKKSGMEAFATGSISKLDFLSNPPARPLGKFFAPDGSDMTLADHEGKILFVNLWATWCPPCVKEMPTLAALQREVNDDRFEVMAVSVDQMGDREFAQSELQRLSRGALTFYHDPNYALPYDLAVRGFPTTIVYNEEGEEIARLAGDAAWDTREVLDFVDALLNDRTQPTQPEIIEPLSEPIALPEQRDGG